MQRCTSQKVQVNVVFHATFSFLEQKLEVKILVAEQDREIDPAAVEVIKEDYLNIL